MTSSATFPVGRPSLARLGTEPLRAALEFVSFKLAPKVSAAAGDGHPVIIFPGLGTDGSAVVPLRDHCRALGYTAMDWGRGFNTGPQGQPDAWLAELAAHIETLLVGREQPVTLIGWSLGGIYARELGKLLAPRVRQVITIGTPFNATADYTNVGWLYRLLSGASAEVDPVLAGRLRTPPPVPTTSIYSRADGVVAWQSCCHAATGGRVRDIEVKGSHIGMGWNPAVLRVIEGLLQTGSRPGARPAP